MARLPLASPGPRAVEPDGRGVQGSQGLDAGLGQGLHLGWGQGLGVNNSGMGQGLRVNNSGMGQGQGVNNSGMSRHLEVCPALKYLVWQVTVGTTTVYTS